MTAHSLSTPQQRGERAETRFFKAWSNSKNFAPWMVSVERPTKHEDLFQKTDAIIIRISGPNLRIQIKSYRLFEEDCVPLMEYGVIPLYISAGDSLVKIRKKTHEALQQFMEYSAQKIYTKKASSLHNSKKTWYKRGKIQYSNK